MKGLLKKVSSTRRLVNLKKNGDQHVSDEDGSSQASHGASDIKSTNVSPEELNNSMQAVSRAIESTRGITGRKDSKQLADYNGQLCIRVVERLSFFTNAVQKIADANLYSSMAWTIMSSVVTVITYTQGIDQDIQDLFETLDSTYRFIENTKEIEKAPTYERILTDIAKQTVDCAYFIRAYAKNSNFWIRAGKNLIGRPIKPRIQIYKDAFAKLLAQFQLHSALHTEIATGRLLECNRSLKVSLDLDSLPYAGGAGLQTGKQCLVGTRTEVLDEIINWINDPDDNCPRLFWLAGPAGVGKSAIAHSIASRFESIGRLGSFFCFDKHDSTKRREKVFSTIARDLADLDPQIKHQLAEVVQRKASLRSTSDLNLQWKNFLLQPLHATSEFSTGPILVVIDALDESGDPILRQDLLNILGKETPSLPSNVRFLVTSRPERDIKFALNKTAQSHIRTKMMDAIPETETNRDILTYFKAKLVEEGSCAFEDTQLRQLVILSQGLFQWAYLASQFLKGLGNTAGLTIAERYYNLINVQRVLSINDPLDAMYNQILSSLFNSDDPQVMTRFRSVIGNILAASEPLSLNSLVALWGDNIPSSRRENVEEVIQHMGALLSGISDPSSTIRPLHLSFREYLLDKNRSHDFSIDLAPCHQGLAFGCLRTMMEGLKFNICNISTSHKTNADDKNLPERIYSSISTPLSYSSRFWARHVISTAFNHSLATKVENFLHHGFLLWLEVLSLLKAVNIAVKSMLGLMAWSSEKKSYEALYNFVADGKRFVRHFVDVIALSAPHIYISALPFCPQDSIIYKTFIDRFPNTLQIASKPIINWPLVQQRPFVGKTTCICFSHRGEYLAAGFKGLFRLLDVETLDLLWTVEIPGKNTDKHIRAIEFYISDKYLVFATSRQVYGFDILTGSLTMLHDLSPSPLKPTYFERLSQNAKFVTYIRGDRLIVWNLQTQEPVIELFWQIPFHRYGFLNNESGDLFVTYSAAAGVQVWDLQKGVEFPVNGHPRPLSPDIPFSSTSALLRSHVSPNGIHIIFPQFNHLRVWNFKNKSVVDLRVSYDESDECSIVAISPDGNCVAMKISNSVILYDMKGNNIYETTVRVRGCNAFSKDGQRFAITDVLSGYLKIWELDGWQSPAGGSAHIYKPKLSTATHFVTASPTGNHYLFFNLVEHSYELWDAELGQSIWKLSWPSGSRMVLPNFSPLNQYLSWISIGSSAINIHDIYSGTTKEFSSCEQKAVILSIAFSGDETLMATLDVNLSQKIIHIRTWDINSCKVVNTLTIPDIMFNLNNFPPTFKASSNLQYFAYSFSGEEVFLYSHRSQSIPLDFLNPRESFCEDFAFSLDEENILISRGPAVFHMNLITNEHRAITLQGNYTAYQFKRQMYSTSSGALLLESGISSSATETYNIYNAFTGELLYFTLQPYPSIQFQDFIPVHQNLITSATNKDGTVRVCQWKLESKEDDRICFSSDEKHSLKDLPHGSSATLEANGWVITQDNKLLFWVPTEYHETLHFPRLKYLIGKESTKLDLSSFEHGQSWTACCNA